MARIETDLVAHDPDPAAIARQFEQSLRQAFGAIGQEDDAITLDDALLALGRLTYLYTTDRTGERQAHLPRPDPLQSKILDALGLSIPRKQTRR